jgi:hypothetical protein
VGGSGGEKGGGGGSEIGEASEAVSCGESVLGERSGESVLESALRLIGEGVEKANRRGGKKQQRKKKGGRQKHRERA